VNDFDDWALYDGAEPEILRPYLDALRAPHPDDQVRVMQALRARLDARLGLERDEQGVETAPPVALRANEVGTVPAVAPPADPPSAAPALPPPPPLAGRPPAHQVDPFRSTALSVGSRAEPEAAKEPRPRPAVQVVEAKDKPKTMQLPVMSGPEGQAPPRAPGPHPLAATLPLGMDRRALGIDEAANGPGVVRAAPSSPALGLAAYVAYRTELALWPESSTAIHAKYGLGSDAAQRELVRYWEGQLAASPDLRARADAIRESCRAEARARGWSEAR
jgi:hypothetical protein